MCCIYVRDFSDRADVCRVLVALQSMLQSLGQKVTCGFKPDVYTCLGIETGNQWHLPPTIYKPQVTEFE